MREGDVLCRLTWNGQSVPDAATDGDIERYIIRSHDEHAREIF